MIKHAYFQNYKQTNWLDFQQKPDEIVKFQICLHVLFKHILNRVIVNRVIVNFISDFLLLFQKYLLCDAVLKLVSFI